MTTIIPGIRQGLILLCTLLLAACAVSPTGRQQLLMMSPQQLNSMGEQAFAQLVRTKPVVRGGPATAYVECVTRAVTSMVPGRWQVALLQDPSANAFALPGGNIGVNTGIFQVARNQDQLAAVIAHEVAHVLSNHHNERASQQMAVQGGLAAAGAVGGGDLSPSTMQALGLGAQYGILLPYGRTQEAEADVVGLDLMARAGFDPRQSIALWQNMSRAGGARPPEFLSTHPAHGTRIQGLQSSTGRAMNVFQQAQARGIRPDCDRLR